MTDKTENHFKAKDVDAAQASKNLRHRFHLTRLSWDVPVDPNELISVLDAYDRLSAFVSSLEKQLAGLDVETHHYGYDARGNFLYKDVVALAEVADMLKKAAQ